MKAIGISILFVAGLMLVMTGCGAVPQEHRGAAKGAGIGAATGAVAGAVLAEDRAEGALLGGLAGALLGGAVGHFTIDKEKDATETARDYGYQPAQGTRVRIEETSIEPQVVRPGEKVEIESTYALLSPDPNAQVQVTEAFEIRHNGDLVGNPKTTLSHDPGTYEASMPLFLPENAEPGTYQVTATISTPAASDTRVTTFTVR